MYPMLLKPAYKDYIWGGKKLETLFHKKSDKNIIAESWEVSCHKDGPCFIANGSYAGMTLARYIMSTSGNILGTKCSDFEFFPFLIKLIDAHDNLSVQVHPSDEYALSHEGQYGKTEMWYVVDCDEGSELIYGFERETSRQEVKKLIQDNRLEEILHKVKVKKGDIFFITSGTIHAIGKGILIAEIQQNSNCTYRVFDYNRPGRDGKPRELHIDKALDVLDYRKYQTSNTYTVSDFEGYSIQQLPSCRYFSSKLYEITDKLTLDATDESFNALLITDGNAELLYNNEKLHISKGQSLFIPAGLGKYTISGKCQIINTLIE